MLESHLKLLYSQHAWLDDASCITLNITLLLSYSWEESHNQRNKYREMNNGNKYYATELD